MPHLKTRDGYVLLLRAASVGLFDGSDVPGIVRRPKPARQLASYFQVMWQLSWAGLDFKACARRLEVVRLERLLYM